MSQRQRGGSAKAPIPSPSSRASQRPAWTNSRSNSAAGGSTHCPPLFVSSSAGHFELADDVEIVWASVQETAEILNDVGSEVTTEEFPRRIEATIDGAAVVIEVEAHDIDRTLIRVTAQKYLGADSRSAENVMNRLLSRLSSARE